MPLFMRVFFLLLACLSFQTLLFAAQAPALEDAADAELESVLEAPDLILEQFPIFGRKKKTSNRRQRKFAKRGSRRNGLGVMKHRKHKRSKVRKASRKGFDKASKKSRVKKKRGCNG